MLAALGLLAVLFLGIDAALGWLTRQGGSGKAAAPTPTRPAAMPEGPEARGACSIFIRRAAHDPASLELVDYDLWTFTPRGSDTWTVAVAFRARNQFGALQLERRTCIVRRTTAGWELVSL